MTDSAEGPERPMTMTQNLVENVRRIREERRLPYTELAAKLSAAGMAVTRMGLLRLERGERRVELDEVAILAHVLGVPPISLFLPLGRSEEVQILPGKVVDTWAAVQWFTGRERPEGDGMDLASWVAAELFERHASLVSVAGGAKADLELRLAVDDAGIRDLERAWRIALRDLRFVRAQIRQLGLRPPGLDEFLDVVDDTTYRFLTRDEAATNVPRGPGLPPYLASLAVEAAPGGAVSPVDFAERPVDEED